MSEGGGDQDNTTSTAVEEKEVEVLKAITEAGKRRQHERATEMRF